MSNVNLGTPVVIDGYTTPASTTYANNLIKNQRGQVTYARQIQFNNQDATNSLKVYINGGAAYITIPKGTSYTFSGNVTSFGTQSTAGTCAWTAVAQVV